MKNSLIGPGVDYSQFTNDVGTNISQFIHEGKTLVFKKEKDAKTRAKELNTYFYCVFQNGHSTGLFAVPK